MSINIKWNKSLSFINIYIILYYYIIYPHRNAILINK